MVLQLSSSKIILRKLKQVYIICYRYVRKKKSESYYSKGFRT